MCSIPFHHVNLNNLELELEREHGSSRALYGFLYDVSLSWKINQPWAT
jgi:hypothetical protein